MYSACLFCHARLGSNEAVEHFAVGRRLAFDPAKGRLWVVCRRCDRWNLTPLEERWEAVEECERLFRAARLRMSTDEIGLARLAEGTTLVRIGRPERREMVAWRYGAVLDRRRRETMLKVGLGVTAVGALVAGGAVAGVVSFGLFHPIYSVAQRIINGAPGAVVGRVEVAPHKTVEVRRREAINLRVRPDGAGGWWLEVPDEIGRPVRVHGETALRAAGALLPAVNRFGATRSQLDDAIGLLRHESAMANFERVVQVGAKSDDGKVAAMPPGIRLALEMAAHEEQERRAMAGELAALEQAWREAEEIAAIADDLLLPAAVRDRLSRITGRS